MTKFALTALAAVLLITPAHAERYARIDPSSSSIHFNYSQMGVSLDARFKNLSGTLDFDTDNPTEAKASIEVDLTSVDTGAVESDQEVQEKSWFHVKHFPKATFDVSSSRPLGDARYNVSGKLTLKGVSRAISFPIEFEQRGGKAVLQGSFTILRGDYQVGDGAWSNFDIVANPVTVTFQITALRGS